LHKDGKEYEHKALKKVQENQVGLKSNATYQLLVYADDVNLLEDNTDIIEANINFNLH
jgi:hypothetical protein